MIRQRFLIVVAVAVLAAGVITLAVSRAGPSWPAQPQSDQIRELEKRVERLEARVNELEQRVPRVVMPAEGPPQLRIAPDGTLNGRQPPKGWIPREFNGQRYYDIPLEAPPRK